MSVFFFYQRKILPRTHAYVNLANRRSLRLAENKQSFRFSAGQPGHPILPLLYEKTGCSFRLLFSTMLSFQIKMYIFKVFKP